MYTYLSNVQIKHINLMETLVLKSTWLTTWKLYIQVFPRYEKRFSYEGGGVKLLVIGGIIGGALGSKLSPPTSSVSDGESSNSMAEHEP